MDHVHHQRYCCFICFLYRKVTCSLCRSPLFYQTTLKFGIEKVLRENFKELGTIIAVESSTEEKKLTMDLVSEAIQVVLPAIRGLGGEVEINRVDEITKTVFLNYKGPPKLIQGLIALIKEIPVVSNVEIHPI